MKPIHFVLISIHHPDKDHLVIQRQKVLKNEKTCIFQQFFVPLRCISIKTN